MTTPYDKSEGPKEGKSAISGKTRKRIFGGDQGVGSFKDWQDVGGAGGPVNTGGQVTQPNEFSGDVKMTLDNQLANMFNPQQQAPAWTGGGQTNPEQQTQNLKMLIDWMRESQATDLRQNPERVYQAAAQASDPVRYAQEQYQARQATDPWGAGGQFAGHTARDLYTPEEILASQGNTAQNQILRNRMPISADRRAQLAGVPEAQRANAGEFDPEELLRQNAIYRNRRSYF